MENGVVCLDFEKEPLPKSPHYCFDKNNIIIKPITDHISKQENFKYSLFSCYEERRLCFLTTVFPCLTFGIVAERSNFGDGYKYMVFGVFSFILLIYAIHFLMDHPKSQRNFYPANIIGVMNFSLLIISMGTILLFISYNFLLRRWIRKFTDLKMNLLFVDFVVSLLCVPCSIIQISRQLHAAEINPENYFIV